MGERPQHVPPAHLADESTVQTEAGKAVALSDDVLIADASTITEIVFGEARGRQAITVTLSGGAPCD